MVAINGGVEEDVLTPISPLMLGTILLYQARELNLNLNGFTS